MYQVTFVILHYLAYQDTSECIESIEKNCSYPNYHIVVVDNCSPNDSYQLLEKKYGNDRKVTLLHNDVNSGFARGNNIGFIYAKEVLNSDFIVMINNDTIINQKNFIEAIIANFEKTNFAVLGPDIISTQNGMHQNPVREKMLSVNQVERLIRIQKIFRILNLLFLDTLAHKVIDKLNLSSESKMNYDNMAYDIQLHGSCLIFSPLYISEFDGLDNRTFMYMEEELLYYRCLKANLKTVYDPQIQILHKEDVSTSMAVKSNRKKRAFIYKNIIVSAKILLETMQGK